ncbi:MAG: DUF4214 domain-containing protein [Pyrinomonadaceae bacterium]|nr:DUF4214 domain-containing protein [Pyrinomonadaceae bacterium]
MLQKQEAIPSYNAVSAEPVQEEQPIQGEKQVLSNPVVVNLAELAHQQALNLAEESTEQVEVSPFMPVPGDLPIPKGARVSTQEQATALADEVGPSAPSPAASSSFQASDSSTNSSLPPDTHGAVGPNHLMVVHNGRVRIQNRSGTTVIPETTLTAFWSSLNASNVFDPKALFDPYSNHWIFTAMSDRRSAGSSVLVGVSQTSDPTGNWNLYRIDADSTDQLWADYPSLGFNKDWVVITANMFTISGDSFTTSNIFVLNKASLFAGGSQSLTKFNAQNLGFTITPAITYDNAVSTMYLLNRWNSNTLRLFTITGAVGSEVFTPGAFVSAPISWSSIPAGDVDFAPQLGSTQKIQNNDDRIQNVVYRNGSLWTTHTVFFPSGGSPTRSAIQWWQLSTTGSIQQRALIQDTSGNTFYAFPSITVNKNNDVLIGYSRFSASQYASANYSFRAGTDPANTLQDDAVLKAGEAPYYKAPTGKNRWGDYSNTIVDPVNDTDMWTIQEYASTPLNGTDRWGTWWGRVVPGTGPPATQPNLTPFQPTGWSNKIVVSKMTGTSTDSTPLTTADTLYIDWAVTNNGDGPTGADFFTKLYVDGVERASWVSNPPLGVNFYSYVQDYSIGQLSAGQHTIRIVTDTSGAITEKNEADNEFSRTISIFAPTAPNLTPFQPTGWSDKIVVSRTTGTSTDSSALTTADTLYVDWAVINNGDEATAATFSSKLYVDGVERASWVSNPPLSINFYVFVQDYSIGTLSAGQHTIKIVVDTSGVIAEKSELDNEYTRVISVASAPVGSIVQLSQSSYSFNEGTVNTPQGFGALNVVVTRTDTSSAATVQYLTSDQSGGNECNLATGFASQRCDYAAQAGTLRFAAGEGTKTIQIPIINDGYIEGSEVFTIRLQNPVGATLGANTQATIIIQDRGVASTPASNPYLSNEFFVRMNYLDFLAREPDAGGWATWPPLLNGCGPEKGFLGAPYECDRAHVSHGFYASPEFTDTGFMIYRMYEVGMGRLPRYAEFIPDMATLSGFGIPDSVKQQNLADYLQQFTAKQEFINRFSDALLTTQAATLILKLELASGLTLPATTSTRAGQPTQYGRQELINLRASGTFTVGQTLKAFVEQQPVYDKYFPRGAVTMEYFAYLKRDPDLNDPNLSGWNEWVYVFINGGATRGRPDIPPRDIHHLIFGFIYSEEYRRRFGAP